MAKLWLQTRAKFTLCSRISCYEQGIEHAPNLHEEPPRHYLDPFMLIVLSFEAG